MAAPARSIIHDRRRNDKNILLRIRIKRADFTRLLFKGERKPLHAHFKGIHIAFLHLVHNDVFFQSFADKLILKIRIRQRVLINDVRRYLLHRLLSRFFYRPFRNRLPGREHCRLCIQKCDTARLQSRKRISLRLFNRGRRRWKHRYGCGSRRLFHTRNLRIRRLLR